MHKGFVEPHSTSTLDTSGGKLTASALVRNKSDVPTRRALKRSGKFNCMPKGCGIKKA